MKANGGKRMSFLEPAHQSYLTTAIAMTTSGHSKNFVDQCYRRCKQCEIDYIKCSEIDNVTKCILLVTK